MIIVGGNSKYEVPINLHSLAMKGQSVLGVHRGTRQQLEELVHLVANGQVSSKLLRSPASFIYFYTRLLLLYLEQCTTVIIGWRLYICMLKAWSQFHDDVS